MSLENLLKIGQLERHETDAVQIGRLLDSSKRFLADARQESITAETRLEAGYRAIMQLSMVALWARLQADIIVGTSYDNDPIPWAFCRARFRPGSAVGHVSGETKHDQLHRRRHGYCKRRSLHHRG